MRKIFCDSCGKEGHLGNIHKFEIKISKGIGYDRVIHFTLEFCENCTRIEAIEFVHFIQERMKNYEKNFERGREKNEC